MPKNLAFQVPHPFKQLALQLPAGHRQPCSEPRLHRPGQPGRQQYHRESPPPLVDTEGQKRWIVECLLGHEDPRRENKSSRLHERAVPTARKYRVRWLGFPLEQDLWEPRSSLLREVPDAGRAYESVHTLGSDLVDDLSVLAVSENETNDDCVVVKRHHDYENKSDCENVVVKRHRDDEMKNDDENVVLNVYSHDHANENVVASARHRDLENESGEHVAPRP
uniref:Chromo domain-containing protein n=1 Tax=Peronospora matthiolae TaxID=2874970 RepID=A0AAV1T2W2_9STRA